MAEILNIDNLVINRVVRGTLFDKSTQEVIVSVDQIMDASLECSGEQVFVTDALGQNIAAFDRSKTATFSASNAILNFGLMAAQLGSDKEVADENNKQTVPAFDLAEVTVSGTGVATAELTHVPASALKYVYSTHTDKSKNKKYTLEGIAEDDDDATFTIAGKVITLPSGDFAAGDLVAVWYDRKTERAVSIKNTTTNFAKGGRFVLEVLVCDVCDTNLEYYAYIIFNNAKMDNSLTVEFSNETRQEFAINAMQDYCSKSNELFTIVVAD